jgi:hypothetical protein
MIHIISDLGLHYLDHAKNQHDLPDGCKYIIITGNISKENKRTMLYITELANKYPESKLIFNFGYYETHGIAYQKVVDVFDLRINSFSQCPPNISYPLKGQIIGDYDFLTVFGWPKFNNEQDFLQSNCIVDTVIDSDEKLYIDDILVTSEFIRRWSFDFANMQQQQELAVVKNWLQQDNKRPKVLITGQGPYSTQVLRSEKFEIFPDVDLTGVTWICGGDREYIGPYKNAKLIQVPGFDRSRSFPEYILVQ